MYERSYYIEVDFTPATLPYIYTFQSKRCIVKQVVFVIALKGVMKRGLAGKEVRRRRKKKEVDVLPI
jgi:hypothetical protein